MCERDDAENLFWTLGGKQVGKGALSGWALMQEACRRADPPVAFWPFDGSPETLLQASGRRLVIAETYPRAYYGFLAPASGAAARWSKRRQSDRLKRIPGLLDWAATLDVDWDPALVARVRDGFSAGSEGADEFDAVVGMLALLAILRGTIPTGEPEVDSVRTVEGWILGRPYYLDVAFPDWFALEGRGADGDWIHIASSTGAMFSRKQDGSYLRSDGGSGLWIRATQFEPSTGEIDHVDGGGTHHRYRIVSLPSPRLPGPHQTRPRGVATRTPHARRRLPDRRQARHWRRPHPRGTAGGDYQKKK